MTSTYDFLRQEAISHLNSVNGIISHLREKSMGGDEDARQILESLGIALSQFPFGKKPATGKNLDKDKAMSRLTGSPESEPRKKRAGRPSRAGEKVTKAFIYNVRDKAFANRRLAMFYNALLALGWIRSDTPMQTFIDLFSGGECTHKIVWMDDVNTLTDIFRRLVSVEKLVKIQKPYGLWQMVDGHFWEKEGNKAFGNERLRKTHTPLEKSLHINYLVSILDPKLTEQELMAMLIDGSPTANEE